MSDPGTVFETHDVSVRLGNNDVLRGVDFTLRRGEFVVLLGPNGSGKTTLVKALLGLVKTTRGTRSIFGEPAERFKHWDRIGYVPQRVTAAAAVPATIGEVVLSGRAARAGLWRPYGAVDREAAARAMELVDLLPLARTRVERLSGGQQQRVLIARALATDPDVLVMDEPVASVDLAHQETFAHTVGALNDAGASILLVAHSLGAMQPLSQRAVVLEAGKVIFDGPPDEAFVGEHAHPHHPRAQGES